MTPPPSDLAQNHTFPLAVDCVRNNPKGPGPLSAAPVARRKFRWHGLAAGVLLAAFAILSFSASLSKGVSFDEGLQLAVGYKLWQHDDYRIEGANGDFVKRWATLPYLVTRPKFLARDDPRLAQVDSYELGRLFFFDLGNRPEALLQQSRAMIVLLGIAAGFSVFWFSRSVFGPVGGLVSLFLFVTSSHMMAFSAIVSTDMSITLTLFGSTMCIWQLLHRVTAGRLLISLVFFAVLLLAKMTAMILLPVSAVLLAVRFIGGKPLAVHWRERSWILPSRRSQAMLVAALMGVHALVGWAAIWAHYGFRFAASPQDAESAVDWGARQYEDKSPGPFVQVVRWCHQRRILPEAYCNGVDWLLGTNDAEPAFMDGRSKLGGWRSFFPYAIWVKTQPSLFVLLALGAVGCVRRSRREVAVAPDRVESGGAVSILYAFAPHLVLIVVYLAVAVTQNMNIGHRHVLPIYLPLYVLAGAVVWLSPRRVAPAALGVGLLLSWRCVDLLAIWPNNLAYFAPQVGGPQKGYKLLVDSSLDWGMDLPGLKRWLVRNNAGDREPVFLSYFGTDSARHHGIKCVRLPSFRPRRKIDLYTLTPGYFAISATLLRGNYLPTFGPWNAVYEQIYQAKFRSVRLIEEAGADPGRRAELLRRGSVEFWSREYTTYDYFRFGRLCAWLRRHGVPPDQVGHSILIWKLSFADLEAALLGPPPELREPPVGWLHLMGIHDLDRVVDFQVSMTTGVSSLASP